MDNFQRDGSISNSQVGRAFEERVGKVVVEHGLRLESNHKVPCGLDKVQRKSHAFDLGSENPKVIVECKSHIWTSSGNVPSAKMTIWVEAMFYFHWAPQDYRKIFFVKRSTHSRQKKSLLDHFLGSWYHMIPSDVEFWELDTDSGRLRRPKNPNSCK